MTGLRVVVAEGSAADRGRQIGRELGDLIQRSVGFYHGYFERRGVRSPQLQDLLAPYLLAAEEKMPELTTLLKAMAEGATVPVWELFAVNAFEELEPLLEPTEEGMLFLQRDVGYSAAPSRSPNPSRSAPDRCSSFTVAGPGYTLMGHNEQWVAGDIGNVAVVVDVPPARPPVVSPTIVCCLPAVGMNGLGGAQSIQSLIAEDDGVGVPRVMVSRHSLEAVDRADALLRTANPNRAGGYGHTFAFAGGDAFSVETTGRLQALIDGTGPHTNHYLDQDLAELAPKASDGSRSRYDRLVELIDERRPDDPGAVMDILRDHEAEPQAICLHPEEDQGDEAAAVVFSMVCDLEARRMWVSPGNPCKGEYHEVDLSALETV